MDTILFLATIIAVLVFLVRLVIKLIKRKSIISTSKTIGVIILTYGILWLIFYFKATDQVVPLATDICFDDWCATLIKVDKPESLGMTTASGQFIVLHIKISNQARGIAQKPSEPRVHIIDGGGHSWAVSETGQQALEKIIGKQVPLDQKLELHQTLETQLAFDVSKQATGLKVLIEEGPFITKLLLQDHKKVFQIH